MELKRDVLVMSGEKEKALEAYNQAILHFTQKYPDAQEPPVSILHRQGELLEELRQPKQP